LSKQILLIDGKKVSSIDIINISIFFFQPEGLKPKVECFLKDKTIQGYVEDIKKDELNNYIISIKSSLILENYVGVYKED